MRYHGSRVLQGNCPPPQVHVIARIYRVEYVVFVRNLGILVWRKVRHGPNEGRIGHGRHCMAASMWKHGAMATTVGTLCGADVEEVAVTAAEGGGQVEQPTSCAGVDRVPLLDEKEGEDRTHGHAAETGDDTPPPEHSLRPCAPFVPRLGSFLARLKGGRQKTHEEASETTKWIENGCTGRVASSECIHDRRKWATRVRQRVAVPGCDVLLAGLRDGTTAKTHAVTRRVQSGRHMGCGQCWTGTGGRFAALDTTMRGCDCQPAVQSEAQAWWFCDQMAHVHDHTDVYGVPHLEVHIFEDETRACGTSPSLTSFDMLVAWRLHMTRTLQRRGEAAEAKRAAKGLYNEKVGDARGRKNREKNEREAARAAARAAAPARASTIMAHRGHGGTKRGKGPSWLQTLPVRRVQGADKRKRRTNDHAKVDRTVKGRLGQCRKRIPLRHGRGATASASATQQPAASHWLHCKG